MKKRFKIKEIANYEEVVLTEDDMYDIVKPVLIEEYLESGLVLVTDKKGNEFEVRENNLVRS